MFKSTDRGETWNLLLYSNGDVYSLAVDPITPSTVYAGRYGGVLKSTDGGETWETASTGLSAGADVRELVFDPTNPHTIYAGTVYGVHKSTDSGESWTSAEFGQVRALAIDPITPTTLYAGTHYGGVFKSTDSGMSWSAAGTGLVDPTVPIGSGPAVYALAIDPIVPTTLYAGTDHVGVFKSTDGGQSWSAANTGLPPSALALTIDAMNPSTLYAGTGNGVFRSTNGGENWSRIEPDRITAMVYALALETSQPTTLYVAAYGAGVSRVRGQSLTCVGDCNGDGAVTVEKVPPGGNIVLANPPMPE